MAQDAGKLDTTIRIITPENIALEYRVAGPFRRLPAYLIDFAVRLVIALLGTLALAAALGIAGFGKAGLGLAGVLWFLLGWFYGGVFETLWNGQTPGKRLLQIRVLSVDGQPINALQAVLRNVLREIDAQPLLLYQVGLWTALMNDRFQRLGDLACGTMVVVEERKLLHGVLRTGEAEAARLAGQIPASFPVNRTLARALAAYVGRRGMFSAPRRREIACHLAEPLRQKFNLPPQTDPDLLLCGLYHREFIAEEAEEPVDAQSPFQTPQSPFAPVAVP